MPTDYNLAARIAYLQWLSTEDANAEVALRNARDYCGGKQPTYLTDRQKEFIGLTKSDTAYLYAHNVCQLVVDVLAERLCVTGFAPRKKRTGATAEEKGPVTIEEWASEWWEANRADALQDEVHHAAPRDGSTFVVVDWDVEEDRPRWSHNLALDGTNGVRVFRDPNTDAILYAAKKWQVYDPVNTDNNGRTRVTMYYPDRVEKYISALDNNQSIGGTGWIEYRDDPEEPWPIPWVDTMGKALGCAVIEFPNPGGLEIEMLMPLQDMLNKSDLDLIACADMSGFRIMYAAGLTSPVGLDGKPEALEISPGHILKMSNPQSRLGAIEPVDTKALIETCKYWIESIAGVSHTPQYLFQPPGGQPPSGESLKQQESGLIHKVERRQRVFGNSWEDVIYLSAKLHNLYRAGDAVEIERVSTEWASAEQFSDPLGEEKSEADIVKVQVDSGMPLVTALRRRGWDDAEIAAYLRDKAVEQRAQQRTLAAAMLELQRNADRGEDTLDAGDDEA